MIASSDAEVARRRIAELDWWHAIEVAPGVVTPGGWDLRATADALPWRVEPLRGLRCLDSGTMDGFWAFELESRGAGKEAQLGAKLRAHGRAPGSRATLRDLSVYDLATYKLGIRGRSAAVRARPLAI